MTTSGEYAISAVGRLLHAGTPLATRALRVWVESPGAGQSLTQTFCSSV